MSQKFIEKFTEIHATVHDVNLLFRIQHEKFKFPTWLTHAQRTLTTIFRVKFGDVQLEKPVMHNSNRVKITSKNVVLRSAQCERESLRVSAFKRTRWCVSLSSGCCLSTIQLDMCEYLVYECVWVSLCLSVYVFLCPVHINDVCIT